MNKYPLKNKLMMLNLVSILPFVAVTFYLIVSLRNYSSAYDEIVSNMTIANSYNLNFKEEMDESLYKLVVSAVTFENISGDAALEDPYKVIDGLREDFGVLMRITTDKESKSWLQRLLRNIDTLEDRVDDIKFNLQEGGHYDENIEMLDNNIYILTELIQDDIQYYIYYQTQSIENLKVQLNTQVEKFIVLWTVLLVCIIVGVLFVSSFISNGITRPIRELCGVTRQISEGDFSTRAGVETQDEVSQLADSINEMSQHLEIMVSQIKEDERKMRYAELRLLQEQINPHFLYNTLDTIIWLIEGNMSAQAVDMVVSLSDFFRLVLSHGKEFITIREEELHIRSYLEIQQVRYHDILDYEVAIAPELYPYRILKLTLQPLVENALYHGIKYKRAKGKITISGEMTRKEDGAEIRLTVKDNGVGMEPEELERLQKEIVRPCKETETGFGLANVNERIRMNFGAAYGMTITSAKGEGTTVQVVIPAQIMEQDLKGGAHEEME
ncbi:MAG: sensor histidine kinase [Roseburia sp.]|nr:sensor histidine kinase [Ruminococcus sp.]MCM1155445.1 sensor histidine kinase [Roseburia sp.]MCM1241907.1 sensor histidine kinase [Roseburia sp.]